MGIFLKYQHLLAVENASLACGFILLQIWYTVTQNEVHIEGHKILLSRLAKYIFAMEKATFIASGKRFQWHFGLEKENKNYVFMQRQCCLFPQTNKCRRVAPECYLSIS